MLAKDSTTMSRRNKAVADRLFFAVFPDQDACTRIAQLADQLRLERGLHGKLLPMSRLHVTLHYLGDYVGLPADIVAKASEAAAAVAVPRFNIAFDRVKTFSGKRRSLPLVMLGSDGVAALRRLQQDLSKALAAAGLPDRLESDYTPHVTLLYDQRTLAEQAIRPVDWPVTEFVLVHSQLGRSKYWPLARWPLSRQV
jgi:2'-5' RNA ligase